MCTCEAAALGMPAAGEISIIDRAEPLLIHQCWRRRRIGGGRRRDIGRHWIDQRRRERSQDRCLDRAAVDRDTGSRNDLARGIIQDGQRHNDRLDILRTPYLARW